MDDQARRASGEKVAGKSAGGQWMSQARVEADGSVLSGISRVRHTSPSAEDEQQIRDHLSRVIPEFSEALEDPADSITNSAAMNAVQWSYEGEPDHVVRQLFEHHALHYLPMKLGSPAPGRRRCAKCRLVVPTGTGVKIQRGYTTAGYCDDCAADAEFRPPMPERTVDRTEHYIPDKSHQRGGGEADEPGPVSPEVHPVTVGRQKLIDVISDRGHVTVDAETVERYARDNFLLAGNLRQLDVQVGNGEANEHTLDLVIRQVEVPERIRQAGIPLPEEWEYMGSSEKDMWQERQIRRLEKAAK